MFSSALIHLFALQRLVTTAGGARGVLVVSVSQIFRRSRWIFESVYQPFSGFRSRWAMASLIRKKDFEATGVWAIVGFKLNFCWRR